MVRWLDWDGICFSVLTSSDKPFSGSSNWVVYPNDFPTQQVELYYDLPVLTYPSEYHTDNSTNGVLSVQPNTAPTCTPAAITAPLVQSALTYQFCYQAYAAAAGSTSAWQVAIQGTFLTNTTFSTSTISGQNGLFIYTVTGTRTQNVGSTQTSTYIVGQTFHNSGTTIVDLNEYKDDPLLMASSPFLVPGYGLVLYTNTQFTYPNGTAESINNQYALVNADPLVVSGSSIIEQQGPKPDWSGFAVQCSSSCLSCPLITSSSNAAASSTVSTSCSAVSSSTAPPSTCTGSGSNGASHLTVSAATLLLASIATSAVMIL